LGLGMLILFQRAFAGLGMMLLRKPLINAKIKQEFNLFIYIYGFKVCTYQHSVCINITCLYIYME